MICFLFSVTASAASEGPFGFEINLFDDMGNELSGKFPIIVNKMGTNRSEPEIESGDVVYIHSDESMYVCDVPDGSRYEIKEVDSGFGYEPVGSDTRTGVVSDDSIADAAFENTRISVGPKMPETGGSGLFLFIAIGVGLIILGICLFKYRKQVLSLVLVLCVTLLCFSVESNALDDKSYPMMSLGHRSLIHDIDFLSGELDVITSMEPSTVYEGSFEDGYSNVFLDGLYSLPLSDWVRGGDLDVSFRVTNLALPFYSRLTAYAWFIDADGNTANFAPFRERRFEILSSSSGKMLFELPAEYATRERSVVLFKYLVEENGKFDFKISFSSLETLGFLLPELERCNYKVGIKFMFDTIQEHSVVDAVMGAWGMNIVYNDGYISYAGPLLSGVSPRWFTAFTTQGFEIELKDDRSIRVTKSVV